MRQVSGDDIDHLFEQFTIAGSPGCALGVMHDGELIFKKGYGLANLEYGIAIEPTTIFHVASMSKQFNALAVLPSCLCTRRFSMMASGA